MFIITGNKFIFGSEDFILALKKNLSAVFVYGVGEKTDSADERRGRAFLENWPGTIAGCIVLELAATVMTISEIISLEIHTARITRQDWVVPM